MSGGGIASRLGVVDHGEEVTQGGIASRFGVVDHGDEVTQGGIANRLGVVDHEEKVIQGGMASRFGVVDHGEGMTKGGAKSFKNNGAGNGNDRGNANDQAGTGGTVTIVSGYFDLSKIGQKTKHDNMFYLDAGGKGMLAIDSPMIIFTDSPLEVLMTRNKVAPNAPTNVVNISFFDLQITRNHLSRLTLLTRKDPETAFGYSGMLFAIYHAKPEMMAKAVELNPFHTDKFLWMDVGSIRDWGGIDKRDYIGKKFPRPEREHLLGRDGRILMQGVAGNSNPCADSTRYVDAENPYATTSPKIRRVTDPIEVPIQPNAWWIAGSMFGGRGIDLLKYRELYEYHLTRYLESERKEYALIDQYLMGALACYSDTIEVVRPPVPCCAERVNRKWFFMLMYLTWDKYPQQPYSIEELAERANKNGR